MKFPFVSPIVFAAATMAACGQQGAAGGRDANDGNVQAPSAELAARASGPEMRGSSVSDAQQSQPVATRTLRPLKLSILQLNCQVDCLQHVIVKDGDTVAVGTKGPVQAEWAFDDDDNADADEQAALALTLPAGNDSVLYQAYCFDFGSVVGRPDHGCRASLIGYKDRVSSGSLGLDSIPAGAYRVAITYANGETRALMFNIAPSAK